MEVRFKGNRREFFSADKGTALATGDAVVVALERGQDLGRVSAVGEAVLQKCRIGCDGCGSDSPPEAKGKILRRASDGEAHVATELRKAEEDVRRKVRERVAQHKLPMKVSDAEWQWDRKKLTIYFTAENRVDFRQLVRDLASLFRTRIELRQIGARDEAKRLSGVGRCGREYCCSSWLPELRPVSLSLAKDQRLSLNPSQISGGCGRLLCCLRYEHEFYLSSRKRFPKEGKTIVTDAGRERVQAVDIFRERVLLRAEDGTVRTIMLADLKQEVELQKEQRPLDSVQPDVPSTLASFDEGPVNVTDEAAADAVTPQRRSRRRDRRRRGRGGSRKPSDGSSNKSNGNGSRPGDKGGK